jgi:hypothetical protein
VPVGAARRFEAGVGVSQALAELAAVGLAKGFVRTPSAGGEALGGLHHLEPVLGRAQVLLAPERDVGLHRGAEGFTAPTHGTNGNQKTQQFRQPGFSEVDLAAFKNTRLNGRLNFQIRFEFYNLFNYDNLYLGNDLSSGGFGKAISQQLPRWWQIGAKLTF